MKKQILTRTLSCVLALIMLLGMVPVLNIAAAKVETADTSADVSVAGVAETTADGFEYIISGDKAKIIAYTGTDTDVVIPSKIEGCTVTSISKDAFSDNSSIYSIVIPEGVKSIYESTFLFCTSLESITLPDGITSIGDSAFAYCPALESITIPSGVKNISPSAFYRCTGLESITVDKNNNIYDSRDNCNAIIETATNTLVYGCKNTVIPKGVEVIGESAFATHCFENITIPEGVTTIGNGAFVDCDILKSITIPKSVTSIGGWAFSRCTLLESIVFPEGVVNVGDDAFRDCVSLKSISIPSSATSISYSAFVGCKAIESIMIDENNSVYDSRDNCNAIIETATNTLIYGCKNTIIPESVETIGAKAFSECTSLEKITIPAGVTNIENYAFSDCINIESITVDEGNSVYDSRNNCNAIIETATNTLVQGCKNTVIPQNVTGIGLGAFYKCGFLEKIIIPEGVTDIEESAFYGCDLLTGIVIPSSVKSIGDFTFYICDVLSDVYYLGTEEQWNGISVGYANDSLMDANIRFECTETDIKEFEESSVVPDGLEYTISDGKVEITGYTGSAEKIIIPSKIEGCPVTSVGDEAFFNCLSLEYIKLPESVTYIGDKAFAQCPSEYIILNEGLKSIGEAAFESCTGLKNITIPDSVTSMGDSMFNDCHSLESVTISSGMTSIGYQMFYNCDSLKNVTIPEGITSLGDEAFIYCSSLESITIPSGTTNIGKRVFFGCDSLANIVVDESNSVYDSRNNCNAIIETATNTLTHGCKNTVIPEGIKIIGDFAFSRCGSIESITIPEGVTTIGESAFGHCYYLESITIPEGVTTIGKSAFAYCYALKSVSIPSSVTSMASGLFGSFYTCPYLEKIVVDKDNAVYDSRDNCNAIIETEKNSLIQGCNNTIIPDDVERIENHAFESCAYLESITIPWSVSYIGNYVFYECPALKSVFIPESVTIIENNPFGNCDSLESIVVDKNNKVYDSRNNCNAIIETATNELVQGCKNTIVPQGVTSIGFDAFFFCDNLESITIPEGVTNISRRSFISCSSLKSVTISSSVTHIGDEAFDSCHNLTDVYYSGTEEQWNEIQIGDYNDYLLNANIHFEYEIPDSTEPEGSDPTESEPTEPEGTVPSEPEPTEPSETESTEPEGTYLIGDANSDGKVNVKDATFIQKAAASLIVLDDMQVLAADVNEDKTVNVKDATAIQKFVASIPVKFPIGEKKHLSRT